MVQTRDIGLHELILDMLSRAFKDEGKFLTVKIKKDNIEFYGEYGSDRFFLCKFHGTTFGVNERGEMPPKIKFTIEMSNYNVELKMKSDKKEGTVIFTETGNPDNFISLNIK